MSNTQASNGADEVAVLIAGYTANVAEQLDQRAERAAKAALIDSIAVALGALTHPAAQAARRHAYRFPAGDDGCVIWGTSKRAIPELAALTNGVLLRCYDYNDFFVGERNSGHASDMVSGVLAAAEWANVSGPKLLSALAVGYEVVGAAYDAFSTDPGGWDYTNLTAIGATCAIAKVLNLNAQQVQEALAMTVVPHFASDEIEFGRPQSARRPHDVEALQRQRCRAQFAAGVPAGVGRSRGRGAAVCRQAGLHRRSLPTRRTAASPCCANGLVAQRPLSRVADTYMKRWPVGSLAQSAIQAALAARQQAGDVAGIKQVRVFAEEGAYDHLVRIRKAPWEPISRETADHSMPYIVAAAVLDGYVHSGSFEPRVVLDPARQRFLKERVVVNSAPELGTLAGGKLKRAQAGYLSRVEIEMTDGRVVYGAAAPPPGHPKNPFTDADFAAKVSENVETVAGAERTKKLVEYLFSIERSGNVRELTALLALGKELVIDAATKP